MDRSNVEFLGQTKGRPFRFGINALGSASRGEWRAAARKAEDLGFSTLRVGDHLWTGLAPLTYLMAAADVTTTLRLGSLVFGDDFRHPALLAREAATIDLLSDGRLELGRGTGWEKDDYEQTGTLWVSVVPTPGSRPRAAGCRLKNIRWDSAPLTSRY